MAQFNLGGINHVVIKVRDLDRSEKFYTELGFERVGERPGMVFLEGGGHSHDLALVDAGREAPAPPDRATGLFHFCVTVSDEKELGRLYRHCLAKGISVVGTADHIVSRSIYVQDPDGHTVEFTVDRPESDWKGMPDAFAKDSHYEPL
ncbi:MAG: VOC family protein [Nitrospirae bacterium]|nr:VOC family protein [Nitrospirota bacterium]